MRRLRVAGRSEHKNPSIKEFKFQIESLILKIDQSVSLKSDFPFREHSFPVRIRFGFLMRQGPVVSFMNERWLVIEGSNNRQIVISYPLIELVVFPAPAPKRIGISVDFLEISGR